MWIPLPRFVNCKLQISKWQSLEQIVRMECSNWLEQVAILRESENISRELLELQIKEFDINIQGHLKL